MKVGILLHPFSEDNPAGLGRSIYELVKALIVYDQDTEYILWLKEAPKHPLDLPPGKWRVEVLGSGHFWLDRGMRRASPVDVALFNTPILPFFFRPKKTIVIAHDFAYRFFPADNFRGRIAEKVLTLYHGFSLRRADHIITVSQAAKEDVMKLYAIAPGKITPVHWGFADVCSVEEEPIALPEVFFLFVGVIKERKNVANVIEGFAMFCDRNKGDRHELVVVGSGKGPYAEKVRRIAKERGMDDRVRFVGFVSDAKLSYIYKRASALVFPSIVEGFGFPILEAMSCGLPVITSTTSSLPEVAGDAALLVDPRDTSAIAAAMTRLAKNTSLRKDLIHKGHARAKGFTWEKTARTYMNVLQRVFRSS